MGAEVQHERQMGKGIAEIPAKKKDTGNSAISNHTCQRAIQIVSGEVPYDNVAKPKDEDPDVSMKKNNLKGGGEINSKGEKTVDIKPTVIKKPSSDDEEEEEPKEDTTPPVPISPKKGK